MKSIEQIVKDSGDDDTPFLDTHNLTGKALPKGVEPIVAVREPDCYCGADHGSNGLRYDVWCPKHDGYV